MLRRLDVRIALIIVIGIPLNFLLFTNINYLLIHVFGVPENPISSGVQVLLLIVSTPIILSWVASKYITRPLREFVTAIESLEQNAYVPELEPRGIIEFDTVVDRLNALARQLAAEEELRKDLISDTAHELNTPLTAMLGQLTAMQDGVLPQTPERLDDVRRQVERLIDLVVRLDEYTIARSGHSREERVPTNLRDVAVRLQEQYGTLLAQARMTLVLDIGDGFTVDLRPGDLDRMLTNLLDNALRYSRGTTIVIAARDREIMVSDDGVGVIDEHTGRLFERFFRVDASRNREPGGLGLGLAIVQELAEGYGWRVRAERAEPGLRIVFSLPT